MGELEKLLHDRYMHWAAMTQQVFNLWAKSEICADEVDRVRARRDVAREDWQRVGRVGKIARN